MTLFVLIPTLVGVVGVAYLLLRAIYRVTLHPLVAFPGPKLRAISHLPHAISGWRGRQPYDVRSVLAIAYFQSTCATPISGKGRRKLHIYLGGNWCFLETVSVDVAGRAPSSGMRSQVLHMPSAAALFIGPGLLVRDLVARSYQSSDVRDSLPSR